MKKFVSVILSLTFVFVLFGVVPTSAAKNKTDDIQSFINESKELLSYETESVYSTESIDEENSEIDFSSCRLILKATKKPDKLNSVGIADGFKDYYIIQFKNEIDAQNAYNHYSEVDYITGIDVDVEQNALTSIEVFENFDDTSCLNTSSNLMATDVPTYDGVPDRLNSWGSEVIGAYAVKDYINNSSDIEKNKVTVAVVDSGIEYDHEYFSDKQDRIEKTGFTTVWSLNNDEYDNDVGHGTAVTSVILDSTPDNIIVRNYKVTDDGDITLTDASTAIFQAVLDGADIINCSFLLTSLSINSAGYNMLYDCLRYVYENNILVVCSAGNTSVESLQPAKSLPSTSEYVLSVTGVTKRLQPTFSMGWAVDVSAPGVEIPCAYKGSYKYLSGTSFSSPLTASVCASMITLNSEMKPDDLIDRIKETATPYDDIIDLKGINNIYGTGFVDALEATGISRPTKVNTNFAPGKYDNEILLELSVPNDTDIYYTLNSEYPTKENAYLYKEPIKVYSDQILIKAVTYNQDGVSSPLFSGLYRSSILEDESKFEIDDNGVITKYNGSLNDIIIPAVIDSTDVKNIAQTAFKDTAVTGITLPETITTLGYFNYDENGSFCESRSLIYIDGENVEAIGFDVFFKADKITFVNFPNCKKIGDGTFSYTNTIRQLNLSKVESVGKEAFFASSIFILNLSNLKSCEFGAFEIGAFYELNISILSFVIDLDEFKYPCVLRSTKVYTPLICNNVEDFGWALFYSSMSSYTDTLFRVEFSKLKSLYDLPGYYSTLVLPSTLEILPDNVDENYGKIKDTYKIYGSKGTLVEEWANENNIPFIEITQETAVLEDLPKYYKSYMGKLEAGVVGFNRQYQWFANNVNSNEGGTPIEGATEKTFDPATYPDAKYYYCEVISTDVGYEPITIKTSACENRMNVAVEKEKSCITNVTYEPSRETRNTFTVTVKNRPTQVQFIEPDGGTRTYDRNHKNVTVKGYDENGNEVNSLDRTLAYEVWDITSNVSTGVEIRTRAKYVKGTSVAWDKSTYNFTVEMLPYDSAIRSITPSKTQGLLGAVETTVVTGPDAQGVRLVMPDGSTCTYYSSKAMVLENGDLKFTGKAWVYQDGINDIKVLVRCQNKWTQVGSFKYTVIEPDATLCSITPVSTSGKKGAVETTVITGPDAQGIRFVMSDGSTSTYYSNKATVLENGDLQFVGNAWANHSGVNTVKILIRSQNKWSEVGSFEYTVESLYISV